MALASAGIAVALSSCAPAPPPRVAASRICNAPEKPNDPSPADLDEAHERLRARLSPVAVSTLRGASEDELSMHHHGLGLGLRNRWGLWGGSRLAKWFCGIGIHHPDDMSAILLTTFGRRLRGEPLGLDELVADYSAYWDCALALPMATVDPKDPERTRIPGTRSPRDGAPIDWIASTGPCPNQVSLGVSDSDGSPWRIAHVAGARVEPARPAEAALVEAKLRDAREAAAFAAAPPPPPPPRPMTTDAEDAELIAAKHALRRRLEECRVPKGTLRIEVLVDPNGTAGVRDASQVDDDGTTLRPPASSRCIDDAVSAFSLPAFEGSPRLLRFLLLRR